MLMSPFVLETSLPNRQLRKTGKLVAHGFAASLPNRQLRNLEMAMKQTLTPSLPNRQLRNFSEWVQ